MNMRAFVLAVTAVLGLSALASADVLIDHTGNNDPVDEGWGVIRDFGATATAVTNDNGTGLNAWAISKSISSQEKGYEYVLTSGEAAAATSFGWVVKSTLRIANVNDAPDYAVSMLYSNGTKRFDLALGSNAAGDPIAMLVNSYVANGGDPAGPSFTLTGGGNNYHIYEMIFNKVTNTADLKIDGVTRISGYTGNNQFVPTPRLQWGAFGGDGTGDGRYNGMELDVTVPEPASIALCTLIPLIALTPRRRRS